MTANRAQAIWRITYNRTLSEPYSLSDRVLSFQTQPTLEQYCVNLFRLFQFHYAEHVWLPALFVFVAVAAFLVLLGEILYVGPRTDLVAGDFRLRIAIWGSVCSLVTTFSAYAGGFVMAGLCAHQAYVQPSPLAWRSQQQRLGR